MKMEKNIDCEMTFLNESVAETVLSEDVTVAETYISENEFDVKILNVDTQIDNYIIKKILSTNGSQANVYLVINHLNGVEYVLKLYKTNYLPQEDIVKLFKNSSCPYVIKIIDDGMYKGQYYEITKYYKKGNLNQKKDYKNKFLNETIVPNINEGLHYLHGNNELGITIIHGDLKPDNIYISDDEKHVIIGDLGISVLTDKTGAVIDSIKGTPEFSPLTTGFYKKVIRNSSYDYASLGLILFKLHYGYSLFANMTEDEITYKWNNGFVIPDSSNLRLDSLIKGLLNKNEEERFGYEDVKKWCDYEFVDAKHKKIYKASENDNKQEKSNYIFGIFDNKVYSVNSLETMAIAMKDNWEQSKKVIKRENFYVFLNEFDERISQKYKKLLIEKPIDIVIFLFINEFCMNDQIVYKGKKLGSIKEFFEAFNDNYLLKIELIENGALKEIVEQNEAYSKLEESLEEVLDTNIPIERKMRFINYLFNQEEKIKIHGKQINTIEEFSEIFINFSKEEILEIVKEEKFIAWLYSHGMGQEALKLL